MGLWNTIRERFAGPADGAEPPPAQPLPDPSAAEMAEPTRRGWLTGAVWRVLLLDGLPLILLCIGLVLTAFAELIGTWAVLGYLLVSVSPVVYWQLRLERKLDRLVELQEKRLKQNR